MNRNNVYTILVLSGVIMTLAVQPAQADNKYRGREHHRRDRVFGVHNHRINQTHSYGHISFKLPSGFISISVGGAQYHYREGVYYRRDHHGYVITPPPLGACINHLPNGYTKIYVDGLGYYTYNEIYYKHTPRGYVVIEKPRSRYGKNEKAAKNHEPEHDDASFEINIPNKQGGYTTVILQRSGNGFTGPQGEYYEEFPRVDNLQVIYGS